MLDQARLLSPVFVVFGVAPAGIPRVFVILAFKDALFDFIVASSAAE
jgi:hypothetical protein